MHHEDGAHGVHLLGVTISGGANAIHPGRAQDQAALFAFGADALADSGLQANGVFVAVSCTSSTPHSSPCRESRQNAKLGRHAP